MGSLAAFSPTLSPTGDLLGTANTFLISQTAADRNGEGISRQLDDRPQVGYLNVGDLNVGGLTWSNRATSTPDDDHMVLLGWTEQGWWLHAADRSALAEVPLLERSLPGSATSIRLADDGVGLLWVDRGLLYHLPAGELEADRLGRDVVAVWPAQT